MYSSQLYLSTLKEPPAEAEIASHQLMLRGGFIRKLASGIYTWLPIGMRVLRKVEAIVRTEMDKIGAQECLMPMLQPGELWKETGRWDKYGTELLRFVDRHQRDFCLGPTHEEVITDLIRKEIRSYKQLPFVLYQIQTKVRDERRPRFGIMRGREFLMKDAYSFHVDKTSLEETYQVMYQAYMRIFERIGLTVKVVQADNGKIGGYKSHEFHAISAVGEDVLMYSETEDYAINQELVDSGQVTQVEALQSTRGIEVGHIFQLGDQYSQAMQATVTTADGALKNIEMGCYGMGISRIVAAAIEQYHKEGKMRLPKSIVPFQVVIIPIHYHKNHEVQEAANRLHQALESEGVEVLLEDRVVRPGVTFADMDLIGVPHRIIINAEGVKEDKWEYQFYNSASQYVSYNEIGVFIKEQL